MVGYHGTFTSNAKRILSYGFNTSTNKKNLWLGNGVYFFTEEIYAFKWILDMHKHKEKGIDFKKLVKSMVILKANLEINQDRLLDLSTFGGKALFDKTYNYMKKSSDPRVRRLLNTKYTATVVIDFLFNYLELYNEYDAVKEIYRINRKNYQYILNDTQAGLPQCQICVKNLQIIKNVEILPYEGKIDDYLNAWDDLISSQPLIKVKSIDETNDNDYAVLTDNEKYLI